MQRAPTDYDRAIHRALTDSLDRANKASAATVAFAYESGAQSWVTTVTPRNPHAAQVIVFGEESDELDLTVGRTWLEVWQLDDPVGWLTDVMDAVIAGRAREVGGKTEQSPATSG